MSSPEQAGSPVSGVTVFIGQKPTMTYVFQVVAELNSGAGPVVVKARGNVIGKAVDVAEVVRHRFLEGQIDVGPIEIGTERLTNKEGREANVSSIAIALNRIGSPPPRGPAPGAAGLPRGSE
ncbi:MAG: DNA-binding protein Alba [Thermoplasmata archaeon]